MNILFFILFYFYFYFLGRGLIIILNRFKKIVIFDDSTKIFDTFAERYKDRKGGYTRIVKIGNRHGDNASTAVIEFVDRDEKAKGQDSGPLIVKKETEEQEQ